MVLPDAPVNGRGKSHRSPSLDFSESGEGPSAESRESTGSDAPADPIGPLLLHLRELREYLRIYLAARLDQWRISAEGLLFKAALGLIAAVFIVTAAVVAAGLLTIGLATAIGVLCGGRIWLGQIIVGGSTILVAFSGYLLANRYLRIVEYRRVVQKYENRKHAERAVFGTDFSERAARHPAG